jgi:hypothetical protein
MIIFAIKLVIVIFALIGFSLIVGLILALLLCCLDADFLREADELRRRNRYERDKAR